jgi:hypothetical protein
MVRISGHPHDITQSVPEDQRGSTKPLADEVRARLDVLEMLTDLRRRDSHSSE